MEINISDASIIHLPTLKSDHKPLLLSLAHGVSTTAMNRPFHLMASWLVDQTFKPVDQEAWHGDTIWLQAVDTFQDKATYWNMHCFGNIFYRKRRLMARMEGINKKLTMAGNNHLSKLLNKLWSEYDNVLSQEEMFWRQQARCDWVKFEDRNTRFFHSSVVIRRKRNTIEMTGS